MRTKLCLRHGIGLVVAIQFNSIKFIMVTACRASEACRCIQRDNQA